VEALARIKTAECTYRTFDKSSLIDSRESNVPTRRSGIWNCCDIQPRGRRPKSLVSPQHIVSVKDYARSNRRAKPTKQEKEEMETKSGTEMKLLL
jgi:hypothetical protein